MSAQHTPGPWYVLPASPDENPGIEASDLPLSIVVWGCAQNCLDDGGGRGRTAEEAIANAALIAAAPEMLEALESVWPFLQEDDGNGCNSPPYQAAINAARAAISKAKGGTR
jgi:hypothetical protein